MTLSEFKVGDRVVIREYSALYRRTQDNPTNDTVGTIIDVDGLDENLPIVVNWNNGHRNAYSKNDLELAVDNTVEKKLEEAGITITGICDGVRVVGKCMSDFYIDSETTAEQMLLIALAYSKWTKDNETKV